MCIQVLPACMSMHYMDVWYPPGPEEAGSLELELHTIMSHHDGAGNWTRIFLNSRRAIFPACFVLLRQGIIV